MQIHFYIAAKWGPGSCVALPRQACLSGKLSNLLYHCQHADRATSVVGPEPPKRVLRSSSLAESSLICSDLLGGAKHVVRGTIQLRARNSADPATCCAILASLESVGDSPLPPLDWLIELLHQLEAPTARNAKTSSRSRSDEQIRMSRLEAFESSRALEAKRTIRCNFFHCAVENYQARQHLN